MRAIAIVGFKNSGKTTLSVEVAKILSNRGLKVGTAKCTHHGVDKEDTDTWKLAQVSQVTAGVSDSETMLVWQGKRTLSQLVPLMQTDVLVAEGCKTLGWLPRVILAKTAEEAEALNQGLALGVFGASSFMGLPVVASAQAVADLAMTQGFVLPGLDCGSCGEEDCAGLARKIVAGQATAKDCRAMHQGLSISIDGQDVAMNDFVRRVMAGALRGMLAELKGVQPGKVRIEFDS